MENSPRYWPIISAVTNTKLNTFPLYTATWEPIISGTIIMFLKCVLTAAGLSNGPHAIGNDIIECSKFKICYFQEKYCHHFSLFGVS